MLLVILAVLYLLRGVLSSFLLAIALVYILNPLVEIVEKRGLGKVRAILLVYVLLFAGGFLIIFYGAPKIVAQLNSLMKDLPVYAQQIQNISENIQERYTKFSLPLEMKEIMNDALYKMEQRLLSFVEKAINSIIGLAGYLLNIILAPVLAFYLLKDMGKFKNGFSRLLPQAWRMDALELLHEINSVLKNYVQSYLLVAVLVGFLVGIVLWILGVDFAFTLAIFAGLMELVPYFGAIIGAIPAVALAFFTSKWLALKVLIAFFLIQQLESNVISPKLLGDKVGLHPLLVIVFLLAGGELYGLKGMLLAIPIVAVAKIILLFIWRKFIF